MSKRSETGLWDKEILKIVILDDAVILVEIGIPAMVPVNRNTLLTCSNSSFSSSHVRTYRMQMYKTFGHISPTKKDSKEPITAGFTPRTATTATTAPFK